MVVFWSAPALGVMSQATVAALLIDSQRWKLWLWGSVLAVSGIGIFAPEFCARALGADPAVITVGAIVIGALVLIGASISIRCPACRLSLAWYGLSKQAHHAWLTWLLTVKTCPRCGFSHVPAQGDTHGK